MPLQEASFSPEMVVVMSKAFEDACQQLGLAQRDDPLRDLVARSIIEAARSGKHDPLRLRDQVLKGIWESQAAPSNALPAPRI